jgi:hypothetical protein
MYAGYATKSPTERVDIDLLLHHQMHALGRDKIVDASSEVTPAGLGVDELDFNDDTVKQWVTGGTVGTEYNVHITVVTEGGRTYLYCVEVEVVPPCE